MKYHCNCWHCISGKDKKRELLAKEYRRIDAKCRCGKDHTNDKPVNEQEIIEKHADSIAYEIDQEVIRLLNR